MSGDGLAEYLRAIMGDEPASGFLEVRPLGRDGGATGGRRWFAVSPAGLADAEAHVRSIAEVSNVYVGVAPRMAPEGHAGAVERVWCLWVDIDEEMAVRDRLWPFRPLPSIVVRSGGGGAHAYWRLLEPLTAAMAQRANRRLALALRADPKATDAARILRPPGTLNHKSSPPAAVVCTRLEEDRFLAGQVVGHLGDTEHYRRRAPSFPRREGEVKESALDGLCKTVVAAAEGSRNDALFWALCRGFEHVAAGGLVESRMLDALSSAGVEAGLGGGEVRATIGSARRMVSR